MTKGVVIYGWLATIVVLFFYSFTQIDLGLTLTRFSWWQTIQRGFQQIGYFQRPTSMALFLTVLLMLFIFYGLILRAVSRGQLKEKNLWRLILMTAIILWFSYNALSYDLFNYLMDARMVTYYGQSPYTHKALDFPDDPMLGFMHWTHRYYPYGPVWLLVTIPLSFLGLQKLLPTMFLIKGLGILGYLLGCWAIWRILSRLAPQKRLFGLCLFAFSPLVILEGLVSAHNDMLMIGLALLGVWYLLENKSLPAYLLLLLSAGVKFVTLAILPLFLWVSWLKIKKKPVNWQRVFSLALVLMLGTVLAAVIRDELKPWYLLYPLAFLPFLSDQRWLFWSLIGWSMGALLQYAPFLYLGNWNPPVPAVKLWLTYSFLAGGVILGGIKKMVK